MSREIDERVVQLRFDNREFENRIKTSIRSLAALKTGLNFDGASKGLENIDAAVKDIDLDPLTRAVEALNKRFSLFGLTAFNVMNRISNMAIDTGKKLITSLSVDQITPGWEKYANKTGAVQTIMAATAKQFSDTGTQMAFVNEQLDKLNWFTDETSYNFVDMVSNIGKFTSNNIALNDSVTAMQGIANWAAISGANANDASRAMYNISQAISSGVLRLEDWMSIENANMGTAAFKEMAIQAAVTAGTLKKSGDKITTLNGKMEVSVESFRNTLSEKWLTNDVLMNTLEQYGSATNKLNEIYEKHDILTSDIVSGIDDYTAGLRTAEEISKDWGITLEETQAYLDEFSTDTMQFGLKAFKAAQEAKTFSDAIESVKDAVSTGWMKTFEIIFGDYMQAKVLWTNLANELYDIFAAGSEARNSMLEAWSEMNGRSYFIDTIYGVLAAILSVLRPIQAAWRDVFGTLTAFDLTVITVRIHDFVEGLILTESTMDKVRSTAKIFFSILSVAKTIISAAASALLSVLNHLWPVGDGFLSITAAIGDFMHGLDQAIQKTRIFDKIFGGMASLIMGAADVIFAAVRGIKSAFSSLTGVNDLSGFSSAILSLVNNAFERFISVGHAFRTVLETIIGSIVNAIPSADNLREAIFNLFDAFSNPFDSLSFEKALDIVNAGLFTGLIVAIKKAMKSFTTLNIGKMFSGISEAFEQLGEGIETFQGKLKSDMLRSIAVSILILAGALAVLSAINPDRLNGALAATVMLFTELLSAVTILTKYVDTKKTRGILKLVPLFISLSAAVLILASATKKLADLGWEGLAKGLSGVTVLIGELTGAMILLSKYTKRITKGASGIILFSISIRILASAVTKIADLSWEGLAKGLSGVTVLIGELTAAMILLSKNTTRVVKGSAGLILFSVAINLLTTAVVKLSSLSWEGLAKGLSGVGGIMLEISIFAKTINKSGNLLGTAASVMVLSIAIKSLASTLILIGNSKPEQIAGGLLALGIALGEIVLTMRSLPNTGLKSSASFVVMAAGIKVLSDAMRGLGGIDSTAKSLIALGGSLFIISKASKSMADSLPGAAAMVVFATALRILAPAVKTFGEMGIDEIVKSLAMLVGTLTVVGAAAKILQPLTPAIKSLSLAIGAFSIAVAILGAGTVMLSAGLAALGPAALVGIGGLTAALMQIINAIPAIVEALGNGIILFAQVIADGAPIIAKSVSTLIVSMLEMLSETTPQIVDLVMDILTKVIAAIAERIPDLTDAGKLLFGGFSEGVSNGVREIVTSIAILLPAIAAATKLLGGAKGMKKKAWKSLAALTGVAAAIGLLVIAFSHIPVGDMNNAIAIASGMAILLPVLSASFVILSKADNNVSTKTVANFGIMSAIASAVGALVAMIGMIPGVGKALLVSEALSVLMPVLTASFLILSKSNSDLTWKTVAQFGIVTAIAAAAGAVVAAIGSIPGVENSIEAAKAIALLLVPLAVVVKILSSPIMASASSAWSALGMLAAIVAALGAVAIGIGKLMQDPAFNAAISDSANGMIALGRAIGGFVGGIVGGLVEGVLSFIPKVGTYLTQFMENAQGFFDGAKEIPDGLGANIKDLATALLALTGAELLNGIANFASSIFGTSSDDLKEKFTSFGEAISAFSNAIDENFDPEKVSAAANAGHALAELESALPRQGGKLQDWLGSKDLGLFGERIKTFGTAIKEFALEVAGVSPDAVTGAAEAGQMLSDLENSLPPQGGVLQTLFGSTSFDNFGPSLAKLGDGLLSFSIYAENIDPSAISTASEAVQALIEMEHGIDRSGGWTELFTGKSDFASFGDNLNDLGAALESYSLSLDNVNIPRIKYANEALSGLLDIAKSSVGFITGLSDFASNLNRLEASFSNYDTSVKSFDVPKMYQTNEAIRDLLSLSVLTEASRWIANVVSMCSSMINTLVINVVGRYDQVRAAGEGIAKWFVKGITLGIEKHEASATSAVVNLGSRLVEAFEDRLEIASPSAVMEADGKWIVRGIAEGIKKDTSAEQAMEQKAKNIETAFQKYFSKTSLRKTTMDLDYQLWEVTEGLSADDSIIFEKQREKGMAELELLAQDAATRNAMLETARQQFGEASDQYAEASNNYKQALITMYQKKNELDATFGTVAQTQVASVNDFVAALKETDDWADMLGWDQTQKEDYAAKKTGYNIEADRIFEEYRESFKMLGKTDDELRAFAQEKSGQTIQDVASDIVTTADIIQKALDQQSVSIEANVANTLSKAVSNGVKPAAEKLKESAGDAASGYAQGLASPEAQTEVNSSANRLAEVSQYGVADANDSHSPSVVFKGLGFDAASGYANGLNDQESLTLARESAETLAKATQDAIAVTIPSYKDMAVEAMTGFRLGIQEKGYEAIAEATRIANAVAEKMRQALQINSPSKVTRAIGNGVGEGFALGIKDGIPEVNTASEDLSKSSVNALDYAKNAIANVLASDDDWSPTITPVLNMDELKREAQSIPEMLNGRNGVRLRTANLAVDSIVSRRSTLNGQNGTNAQAQTQTNYNFTQNNYSPKALNRLEIYRQTNNQFARFKGASQK